MADLKNVLSQAEELLQQASNTTGEQAQQLRDQASKLLEQVKEQTAVLQEQATKKAREAAEATQVYVKDNPLKAVGIAAGVGVLLGALLSSSKKR